MNQNNNNLKGFAIKFYITKYCNTIDSLKYLIKKTEKDTLQLLTTTGEVDQDMPLNYFVWDQLYNNMGGKYPNCYPNVDTLWYKLSHPSKIKPKSPH